jgi:hypothetical protein
LRREDVDKTPGIAETLDLARALVGLDIASIEGSGRSASKPDLSAEVDLKRLPREVAARLIANLA